MLLFSRLEETPDETPATERQAAPPVSTSRLANVVGSEIGDAFERFQSSFRAITLRAGRRFRERDWRGLQSDASERLELYTETLNRLVARITDFLGKRGDSRLVWIGTKAVYSGLIQDRDDWEIAETFFNSVTRRIFTTVGVDNEIEFVHTDYRVPPKPAQESICRSYSLSSDAQQTLFSILSDYDLPWSTTERAAAVQTASAALRPIYDVFGEELSSARIEMVRACFYRGEYAYLVGRVVGSAQTLPVVICIHHAPEGCQLRAVLTESDDLSLLFSYARSYFHVDASRPFELVRFVRTLIPHKPIAEIYISIGYNRHGKTELYRDLLQHVHKRRERFQLAEGQRGMVMIVFTMPSFPFVFKIIKDEFDYPKDCTRASVMNRYHLIYKHDRVGRLIDAQEFQFLEFLRSRFADSLLDELLDVAAQSIAVVGDRVVVKHCYVERRVLPLNLYLRSEPAADTEWAVVDYGNAIKDLAASNLFPGDLLLKNFGVTRQHRVVFYDYDEVCLLTDCRFRSLPEDFDFSPEPSFGVGRADVFPEEFSQFLGLPAPLKEVFHAHHGDLFSVEYWKSIQARIESGEIIHVLPIAREKWLSSPN